MRFGKEANQHRKKQAKWPVEESSSQIWLCSQAPCISRAHLPRSQGPQVCVPKRKQLPGNSYNGEESAVHLHILLCCLPNCRSNCPRIQRRSPLTAGSAGGSPAKSLLSRPDLGPCGPHCGGLALPTAPWVPETLKRREKGQEFDMILLFLVG